MLLDGKKLLITGVLTPQSIAFAAARSAQEHGAEIVLTNFGRTVSLTQKTARRLPAPCDVLELDANDPDQIDAVRAELASRWGRVDGVLHAIAFAPQDALGGNFLHTPWTVGRDRDPDQHVLAQGARHRDAAADGSRGRLDRVAGLRRAGRVADLRLDGRREGGARGRHPVPRARPRAQRHPREHREGGADQDDGRQGHPRVRPDLRGVGRARAARVGPTDPGPVGDVVAFLLSDLARGSAAS